VNRELLDRYLARWRELGPRERIMVAGAGGLLVIVLFYLLLWSPMQQDIARLRASVPKERAKLAMMQAQASQVAQLRTSAGQAPPIGNLLSTLEQSAVTRGLRQNINRIEPEGAAGARVSFDEVSFNALVGWLADLQGQGIRVENAGIQRRPGSGLVSARLLLRGPGS
jgi:general secretion pathway protein M